MTKCTKNVLSFLAVLVMHNQNMAWKKSITILNICVSGRVKMAVKFWPLNSKILSCIAYLDMQGIKIDFEFALIYRWLNLKKYFQFCPTLKEISKSLPTFYLKSKSWKTVISFKFIEMRRQYSKKTLWFSNSYKCT